MFVGGESAHVAEVEAEPAADAGVGVRSFALRAGSAVEADRFGIWPVEDDEGVGSGGVAGVFGPVVRVGKDLG